MTKQVGDERAIRLRNPDAYELHSVAKLRVDISMGDTTRSVPYHKFSHTLFK